MGAEPGKAGVGVAAGGLGALRPRTGGYVVTVWLWAIIVILLVLGDYNVAGLAATMRG